MLIISWQRLRDLPFFIQRLIRELMDPQRSLPLVLRARMIFAVSSVCVQCTLISFIICYLHISNEHGCLLHYLLSCTNCWFILQSYLMKWWILCYFMFSPLSLWNIYVPSNISIGLDIRFCIVMSMTSEGNWIYL